MIITRVESTTLAGIAYDAAAEILYLEFHDQTAYRYFDVPSSVWADLQSAGSKGTYFNRAIRGRFSCQKLRQKSTLLS